MGKIKTCVSLYSLQDEYMHGRMSLEDIFRFLRDNGVEGIEFLPDQMLHGSPHPSVATLAEWDRLVATYQLQPVIADVFLNTNLFKNRELTERECVQLLADEIRLADRLGIRKIRLVSMVPHFIIEPLLPIAEKHNVWMGLEIHAGLAFEQKKTRDFVDEMRRLNSPYVGLVIDTGIFCRKLPRVMAEYCQHMGANRELIDYIDSVFAAGGDIFNTPGAKAKAISLCRSPIDHFFAGFSDGYENLPFTLLDEYLPFIKHFHFKLFEMTQQGPEYSMDYNALMQYLHRNDWEGYVSTEYEGNRWILPGQPMQEKEQVLAHQTYIRKCLKDIQG